MLKQALAVSAGAVGGAVVARRTQRAVGRDFGRISAVSLLPVAMIYPLARRSLDDRGAVVREVAGVAAMGAIAVAGARGGEGIGRLAAAGWLAHAVFDLVHDRGTGSRLPDWYPAACAGYDAAYAVVLVAPGR